MEASRQTKFQVLSTVGHEYKLFIVLPFDAERCTSLWLRGVAVAAFGQAVRVLWWCRQCRLRGRFVVPPTCGRIVRLQHGNMQEFN